MSKREERDFQKRDSSKSGRRHRRSAKTHRGGSVWDYRTCPNARSLKRLRDGKGFKTMREVADCLQMGIRQHEKAKSTTLTHLPASTRPISLFIFVHSSFLTLSPAKSAPTSNTVTTPAAPPTPSLFPSFSSQQTFSRLLAA